MSSDNDLKAICSVTELAGKLGLSRSRFYQLQKTGVFPMPVYCIRTKRPFYPLGLQQKCLDIRKTGIGLNGQPVLFNTPRRTKSDNPRNQSDCGYEELADALRSLGLNVTRNRVKDAVDAMYPEGLAKHPVGDSIIRDLFRYLGQ